MQISVAALSYFLTAFAFLLLSVLMMTRWRAGRHSKALAFASLVTTLWAVTIIWQGSQGTPISLWSDIFEIFRNAGWSVFLILLLGPFQQTQSPFKIKTSVLAIAGFYLVLLAATIYVYAKYSAAQGELGFLTNVVGRVATAVMGMLLVEQLYRNTPAGDRWGIKFACFGIGGLFVYDFYLYSDAMLFRQLNPEIWIARGAINALTVPLMAISVARNPKWSLGLSVSRRVLFHSAALFGSAIYLLAMAAAGYYLRYFGGRWGTVMQVTFLFGAIVLLIGVLFSGTFRARLKVLISKHFYSYNYDYREEWLRFTRTLSEEGPGLNERTIHAVANLVESPGGAVFIRRETGKCVSIAQWNMALVSEPEPLNGSFCNFLENKQWVINLHEYQTSPEIYEGLELPEWLQAAPKAWLVVPLIMHGDLFGFMVLAESRGQIKLNWEVIDLLKIAGCQAASYLAQQDSANSLMVARQFESFNRMSTFMVHDLKNLVSQLSLLLSNAEKHKDNPEFQRDMLETVDYSVQKMKLLLQKLSRGASTETSAPIALDKLLLQAINSKAAAEPKPKLEIVASQLNVYANWARLERVIGHIIQNAIEATPRNGEINIRLSKQDTSAIIEISDNGEGMSEEFIRERLFQPFESTKLAGMGIGVFESREYMQELGGQLLVTSQSAIGTTFRMILPLHINQHAAAALA